MDSSMSVVPPPCQVPETIRRSSSHCLGVGRGGEFWVTGEGLLSHLCSNGAGSYGLWRRGLFHPLLGSAGKGDAFELFEHGVGEGPLMVLVGPGGERVGMRRGAFR